MVIVHISIVLNFMAGEYSDSIYAVTSLIRQRMASRYHLPGYLSAKADIPTV